MKFLRIFCDCWEGGREGGGRELGRDKRGVGKKGRERRKKKERKKNEKENEKKREKEHLLGDFQQKLFLSMKFWHKQKLLKLHNTYLF